MRERKTEIIFASMLLLIIDRVLKFWFYQKGDYILNKSTSWDLFSISWFWVLALLGLCLIVFKNNFKSWGLILICLGGISNLADRLIFGGVIDYIKIPIFPVFNLSDLYITIGIFIIVLKMIRINKKDD